jgi:predicted DNA-binding transcriptional regulator AlpA
MPKKIPPKKSECAPKGWTSTAIIKYQREQLARNGLDPAQVPDEPFHIKRLPEVRKITGLSDATIYRRMNDGSFPKSIAIGPAPRAHVEDECAA